MSTEPAIDIPNNAPPQPPIAGGKSKSALIAYDDRGVSLRSLEDTLIFAKAVIDSNMAPKSFDTPQKVLVAIQMGAEVGLPPMAALQNIAVINGRPSIWGDAVPGICQSMTEDYKQEVVGSDESYGYRVTVRRKGRADPIVSTFTVSQAKKAGLWGKAGPWTQYPDRMLLNRARTFAMRDAFPDKMRGLLTVEEVRDMAHEPKNVTASLSDLDNPPASVA